MKDVDETTFDNIVKWLQNASNYAGTGRHNVDGTSYYMDVNGTRKLAAENFVDDYRQFWHFQVHE